MKIMMRMRISRRVTHDWIDEEDEEEKIMNMILNLWYSTRS
jgi:hypothetical protein